MLIEGPPRAVWNRHSSCHQSQSCLGCRSRKSEPRCGVSEGRRSSRRPRAERGARARRPLFSPLPRLS
eukprot:15445838-Alexandrium_andersonii.AAC.1